LDGPKVIVDFCCDEFALPATELSPQGCQLPLSHFSQLLSNASLPSVTRSPPETRPIQVRRRPDGGSPSKPSKPKATMENVVARSASAPYWVYRNWIHERARVHKATCSHCNNGNGTQGSSNSVTGEWKPFSTEADAKVFLAATTYEDAKLCGVCMGR
jgi:hypothetical protein